ncbi:MAG: hypothetical protein K2Y37_03400 [Pirellulales bacterium]|nr:hypothetical protein [Pirellulales bacterium]
MIDLQALVESELFDLFSKTMAEMQLRRIVRSSNNPVADYAESLVARALGLTLVDPSTKGHDAEDGQGLRYEIKARRVFGRKRSRQVSPIRGLDERHFDYLAGVLFNENFSVARACLIPFAAIGEVSTYRAHVNGNILHLRDLLWNRADVRDITTEVRAAAESGRG